MKRVRVGMLVDTASIKGIVLETFPREKTIHYRVAVTYPPSKVGQVHFVRLDSIRRARWQDSQANDPSSVQKNSES